MTKFVKLGTVWFRPEDIKYFKPNKIDPSRADVTMQDGVEWTLSITSQEMATILNGEKP